MTQLYTKFQLLETVVSDALVERNKEARSAVLALLSRKHMLLVGPPGVAKSLLIRTLTSNISDFETDDLFVYLFSAYSTPEEVFGPMSLKALEDDRFCRQTRGKLPVAKVAVLEEALALDTPVPTPDGWTTIGEIQIGDHLIGSDGRPTRVVGLTPVALRRKCYRVGFRDGSSIVADADHLWASTAYSGSPTTIRRTHEMAGPESRYHVPLPAALDLPEVDLPTDPYVLGLWLGNGNNWNAEMYIRSEWFESTLSEVQKVYPEAHDRQYDTPGVRVISMGGTKFRAALGELDLIQNKHMPEIYLRASRAQRLALLQGLMDTDGSWADGTCIFSSTNESIVDGALELARSLGWYASKKRTTDTRVGTNGPHKPHWKVTFHGDLEAHPFRARPVSPKAYSQARHMLILEVQETPSVPVRCVKVDAPDHLFVAGESMVLTHNCFKANSAILNSLLMIMNEREFVNDGVHHVPLSTICAASNEFPQGEELQAMYDRLLIRHVVQPISEPGAFLQMLQAKMARAQGVVPPEPVVSWAEIEAAQAEVQQIVVPIEVLEAVTSLQFALQKDGISPSPRRMAECLELIQAATWLRGATSAEIDDCRCLQHSLWTSPDERVPVAKHVLQLANPLDREALDLAENVAQLREEVRKTLQSTDKESQQRTEGLMLVNKRLKEAATEFKSIQARANKAGRQSEILDQLRKEIKGINEQIGQEIFGKGLDD